MSATYGDGRSLLSRGLDREIRLWHIPTGRPLYQFDLPELSIWQLHFSPDGSQLDRSALVLYDTGLTAE